MASLQPRNGPQADRCRRRSPGDRGSRSARVLAGGLALALVACGKEPGSGVPRAGDWPVAVEVQGPATFERIVLVTIDTLRADHVSAYGYPRRTTPFLDSLAERGVLFENALAAISHTAPSHATMLTGLVPAAHGVLQNGSRLDPGALDLARLAHQAGVESGAFLNVGFLAGIAAAFDQVDVQTVGRVEGQTRILSGEHVVAAAERWVAEGRKERFLLWVHLYDPHKWKELQRELPEGQGWVGTTPPDFLATVARLHGLPESAPGTFEFAWKAVQKSRNRDRTVDTEGEEGFRRAIEAYDLLTTFADRQVGRLYDFVEGRGLPGRTLWIVTSDHGEGLASHGFAGHGGRIYQEQLRVPLIVHASDGSIAPARQRELVAHVDLFATVAEALGRRTTGLPGRYEGRSLWPIMRGERPDWQARRVFAQRKPNGDDGAGEEAEGEQSEVEFMFALQDARHKFLMNEPGEDEFYDLEHDPLELHNLIGGGAATEAALRAELDERLRVLEALSHGGPDPEVPEEWLQELRDLGYAR